MVALFDDKFQSSQVAMRGGTLLHKVHLAPAARYSEDIDLVVVGPRPAEHIRRAIRREGCTHPLTIAETKSRSKPSLAGRRSSSLLPCDLTTRSAIIAASAT
jgi:predicted nucleotidyltransferase component of viral defense system